MSGIVRINDQQIKELLQELRGLPVGSPESTAAVNAMATNDRLAVALMVEDLTEHSSPFAKRKRTTLRDDLRYSVDKFKLKAYLKEHPLDGFDLDDAGAINNLLKVLDEPQYFDRFHTQPKVNKGDGLRNVTHDREI